MRSPRFHHEPERDNVMGSEKLPPSGEEIVRKMLAREDREMAQRGIADGPCVMLIGNLSDGLVAYGPYADFDEAKDSEEAAAFTIADSWIMPLRTPQTK